ncbi:LysM peptidoglycan-binding domain-containing protein [Lutimaribacter sp. EGI FJ00015]|nr:LysM peptidoglycan-binding domain-containing protein [Lutimaribacter sp. EGI FJ00015]MCO0635061.1 LysM peptidoglycan-binding domain-containing protein [Lutimaribacter sp. EGI FJ00014]
MSKFAIFSGPGAVMAGGAVAVAAVVAGVILWDRGGGPGPAPQPQPMAEAPAGLSEEAEETDAAANLAQDSPQVAAPAPDTPPADAAQEAPAAPQPPRFALVRAERDGLLQVAGTAEPGGTVTLLLDEARIGEAIAGSDGSFAAMLDVPPSDKPRLMRLELLMGEKVILSDQEVIIAPSAPAPVTQVAEAATDRPATPGAESTPEIVQGPEDGQGNEALPNEETTSDAPSGTTTETGSERDAETATETETETTPPAQVVANAPTAPAPTAPQAAPDAAETVARSAPPADSPAVLLSDAEGVRVIQPATAGDAPPEVMTSVAIDAITYSDAGEVELAGRSPGEGFVRIYLDNKPITTSQIDSDGSWRTDLPQVDSGIYTLRVDQIDEDGAVVSRVETPFKREDTSDLAEAAQADGPARAITVQPGNTLWAIARDRYGEGIMYVEVFRANAERIRDPDLIYPGQVFDLPALD